MFQINNSKFFIKVTPYNYELRYRETNNKNGSGFQGKFLYGFSELDDFFLEVPKRCKPDWKSLQQWLDDTGPIAVERVRKARESLKDAIQRGSSSLDLGVSGKRIFGTKLLVKPYGESGYVIDRKRKKGSKYNPVWHFSNLDNLLMALPKLLVEEGSWDDSEAWRWAEVNDAVSQYEFCVTWTIHFIEQSQLPSALESQHQEVKV